MLTPFPKGPSDNTARSLAVRAAKIVMLHSGRVPAPFRAVGDQAIRAAASVALNLAEAEGRSGRDRHQHRRIAYGSALEATTAIELLVGAGSMDDTAGAQALELLDRVRAMTWRLLHPRE